jgi:hypothetical protein
MNIIIVAKLIKECNKNRYTCKCAEKSGKWNSEIIFKYVKNI